MIGTVVGAAFALGIFLVFLDIDRSRRASRKPKAVDTGPPDAYGGYGYAPPPHAAPDLGLRDRFNNAFQPVADQLSSRRAKKGKPSLVEQLAKADIKLRPSEFVMVQVGCVIVMAVIGLLRFGLGPQLVIMGVSGYFIPGRFVRSRQKARLKKFNTQLGDTLILLSNALKTGYSFPQAIDVVAKKGAPPISLEFARVVREMNLGTPADDALAKMVLRIDSADLDLVVSAVSINQTVGGNLAEILETISGTIRERVKIKGEIQTLTAQARASGYIITALPIVLAVFMYFVTPAYFLPMVTSPIGWVMLGIGAALIGGGQFIISKVVAIKV